MKRRNIYLLVFLGCLISTGCFIHYYFNNIKPAVKIVSQPMQVAFQSSNAIFVETKLQGWAKINDHFSTKEELLSFGSQIEHILGLEDAIIREEVSDQGFNSLKVAGEISDKVTAEIIFQSLTDTNSKDETYLIINMVDSRGPGFLNLSKEKMGSAFRLFQQEPEINQLMIGFQDGKLSKKSYSDTISGIFSSVGGRISGEVEEENYFSSTGYVPNIEEKLKVGQKDINIQVAMSYDELENKTYIYIGSPLVYSDY